MHNVEQAETHWVQTPPVPVLAVHLEELFYESPSPGAGLPEVLAAVQPVGPLLDYFWGCLQLREGWSRSFEDVLEPGPLSWTALVSISFWLK